MFIHSCLDYTDEFVRARVCVCVPIYTEHSKNVSLCKHRQWACEREKIPMLVGLVPMCV